MPEYSNNNYLHGRGQPPYPQQCNPQFDMQDQLLFMRQQLDQLNGLPDAHRIMEERSTNMSNKATVFTDDLCKGMNLPRPNIYHSDTMCAWMEVTTDVILNLSREVKHLRDQLQYERGRNNNTNNTQYTPPSQQAMPVPNPIQQQQRDFSITTQQNIPMSAYERGQQRPSPIQTNHPSRNSLGGYSNPNSSLPTPTNRQTKGFAGYIQLYCRYDYLSYVLC